MDATADGVTLAWETVSELDTAGFNAYRGATAEGPWTLANVALIPAAAPGSSVGHSYSWVDPAALAPGQRPSTCWRAWTWAARACGMARSA